MSRRTARLNDLLREEISELIRRHIKDPRLHGLISVTEVEASPDLRFAKVFISVLGSDEDTVNTLKGLRHAAGFLRHELRGRLTLRHIPELSFRLDRSIEQGAHIMQLLREIMPEQENESAGEGGPR